MEINGITERIIGSAIEVHRAFGPGLLESVYEACLAIEFAQHVLVFERQLALPLYYKGQQVGTELRLDFLVENQVVVELKAVDQLQAIHQAQLLTYLKLSQRSTGLLINFNVPILKRGIKRLVNDYAGQKPDSKPSATQRLRGE